MWTIRTQIYAADFRGFSDGFWLERSPHQADPEHLPAAGYSALVAAAVPAPSEDPPELAAIWRPPPSLDCHPGPPASVSECAR